MIAQNDALAAEIVYRATGQRLVPPFVGLVLQRGQLVTGAIVLNCYTGENIEMSAVLHGNMSIAQARAVARYAFEQLGCVRMSARIRADDEKSRRILTMIGFVREGIERRGYRGQDAHLFGLLREECRLLRATHESATSP